MHPMVDRIAAALQDFVCDFVSILRLCQMFSKHVDFVFLNSFQLVLVFQVL